MKQHICKACGAEVPAGAKHCTACGAKQAKPIYQKWWFWVIIAIVVIGIISAIGGGSKKSVAGSTNGKAPVSSAQTDTSASASVSTQPETPPVVDEGTTSQPATETAGTSDLTMGQKNALDSAKSYLNFTAFSYDGLIDQLEYEKYSTEDATYAADNCGADWNEQALLSALSYLDYTAFSYSGLIGQLEYEQFTTEQATYAADNCGADWNEQAAKSAESYLEYTSFSRDGLIDQLEYEGFTHEQAVYGVDQNGL